jgi:hypothetical protein
VERANRDREKDSAAEVFRDLNKASSYVPTHLVSLTVRSTSKVNAICDALRNLLESQDLVKYVETILTTHACKQPPDYESGLRLLLQLQSKLMLSSDDKELIMKRIMPI